MMASNIQIREEGPSEVELLLPWYAAGSLSARDARRVEQAIARDPQLAGEYAAVRAEYAEMMHLNQNLGAPSPRVMHKLFAAIDAEPARTRRAMGRASSAVSGLVVRLSRAHG